MGKIAIDDRSRLVSAADLGYSKRAATGKAPLDFARDHIVILDPTTGRPVAECWPIEREAGEEPPRPVLAGVGASTDPSDQSASAAKVSGTSGVPGPRMGPLSEPQRQALVRICRAHPDWGLARVGEEFERQTGREVSAITVEKYRQEAKGKGA